MFHNFWLSSKITTNDFDWMLQNDENFVKSLWKCLYEVNFHRNFAKEYIKSLWLKFHANFFEAVPTKSDPKVE